MRQNSFCLTLMLLAGSICGYADSVTLGNLTYWLENERATVTKLANSSVTELTIPDNVENEGTTYLVTAIGDKAFLSSGLVSVTLPNSLKTIGNSAFSGCSSLTSATIPNSVGRIGDKAFYGCAALTSINIPNSVTSIGEQAFAESGLTSVAIPNSVKYIAGTTFGNCIYLSSATIPNSVTSIGKDAFRNCTSLTSISIPNSVTSIIGYAFYGCSSLTSVTIPNSVESIEGNAFGRCTNLDDVYINIVDFASNNICYNIAENIHYLYEGQEITESFTIPDSVTGIGNGAFYGCTTLTSITIPNSVTRIGEEAFYECFGLTSVTSEIEVPFAFGSMAFANIPTDCVLYVPKGTRDAYIDAGWTEDVFWGGVVEQDNGPDIRAKMDVNDDGEINTADITRIYNYIITGK